MSSSIFIKNARLMDPASGRDEQADLLVQDGRVMEGGSPPRGIEVYDGSGLVVAPGLVDIHVHLREPGGEVAETVESGSRAAARGGFTTIVAMPNTTPPIDTPARLRDVCEKGLHASAANVLSTGCITVGRDGGQVADLPALAAAGAAAFTDDGCTVQDDDVMRDAMVTAAALGVPIMDHAQDRVMEEQGGVMHEGSPSRRAGLPGIPSEAEIRIVARDIRLSEETGCAVHIQHVTTREAVDLISQAQAQGLLVTGEASPHHIALSDEDIDPNDADYKMNPPLRTPEDREALRRGIVDGVLGAFATDHAPHEQSRKARGFLEAPFGVVGLETAIGVTYTELVRSGEMGLMTFFERWTVGPSRVLSLPRPSLQAGEQANLVVVELETPWTVRTDTFLSRSHNTPFKGRTLYGRALLTLCRGAITWRDDATRQPR